MNGIPNITRTVTIKTNKVGAAQGMHKTLSEDTVIQAHRGERVDIGSGNGRGGNPSSDMGFRGGSGGSGGQNTFVIPIAITIPANDVFPERTIRQYVKKITGSDMAKMS